MPDGPSADEIELGDGGAEHARGQGRAQEGRLLISVNGQPIHSRSRFQEITKNSGGKPVDIEYRARRADVTQVTVQPVYSASSTGRRAG